MALFNLGGEVPPRMREDRGRQNTSNGPSVDTPNRSADEVRRERRASTTQARQEENQQPVQPDQQQRQERRAAAGEARVEARESARAIFLETEKLLSLVLTLR